MEFVLFLVVIQSRPTVNIVMLIWLDGRIRSNVRRSFSAKNPKDKKTVEIIGCSFDELRAILGQPTKGDELDHKIPIMIWNKAVELNKEILWMRDSDKKEFVIKPIQDVTARAKEQHNQFNSIGNGFQ